MPDYLERQAVSDLAGIAAEQLLNGRVIWGSYVDDISHARGIAERLVVEDVQAFIDAKLREAEAIVSANRAGVEAVRRALVEKRTLKGPEVRAILATN